MSRPSSKPYPFAMSTAGCFAGAIGALGLDAATLKAALARLDQPLHDLVADYDGRRLELLRISEETADIAAAERALATLSTGARTIVFFGTGGSGLGGQTLAQLAGWSIPGLMAKDQRKRPRTRFYDNLDAASLAAALADLDLATTRFVVTSKSGSTVETLVQTIAAIDAMRRAGLDARIGASFLAITEPPRLDKPNALRDLLTPFGVAMLDHPTGIGGRFSVLSTVGLVPALARGLDVRAMRAGANAVKIGRAHV